MNCFVRTSLVTGIFLCSALSLSGCSSVTGREKDPVLTELSENTGTDLFGGGMVCNATLLSGEEDTAFSYELPVISPEELHQIELTDISISGKGDYSVQMDHVSEGGVYRGWYYCYIHLKISAGQKKPADFSIDSLEFDIDGTLYRYTPRSLRFYNPEGLYGQKISDEGGILLYKDTPEVIFSSIPSDPSHPVSVSLEVHDDCTVSGFEALDFLEITDVKCKVNHENVPAPGNGRELPLEKGDELEISFCLQYEDGCSETDLIKTSRILRYADREGTEYLLNEPQGFLLIDFENDRMIHSYIDREILSDE